MSIEIHPDNDRGSPAAASIPWGRLTHDEKNQAALCAARFAKMVRDIKRESPRGSEMLDPDAMLIMMDICNVHLARGLNLFHLLICDDLVFLSDMDLITKNVDRACGAFPFHVRLACQRDG